jgi:transposase
VAKNKFSAKKISGNSTQRVGNFVAAEKWKRNVVLPRSCRAVLGVHEWTRKRRIHKEEEDEERKKEEARKRGST